MQPATLTHFSKIPYTLKSPENLWFFNVFWGYKIEMRWSKTTPIQLFPWNFPYFLRIAIIKNTSGQLFRTIIIIDIFVAIITIIINIQK